MDISSGFYVTELIGMGINMVTGDYSRGATGFWIENGEIALVTEMTVAGNLKTCSSISHQRTILSSGSVCVSME